MKTKYYCIIMLFLALFCVHASGTYKFMIGMYNDTSDYIIELQKLELTTELGKSCVIPLKNSSPYILHNLTWPFRVGSIEIKNFNQEEPLFTGTITFKRYNTPESYQIKFSGCVMKQRAEYVPEIQTANIYKLDKHGHAISHTSVKYQHERIIDASSNHYTSVALHVNDGQLERLSLNVSSG